MTDLNTLQDKLEISNMVTEKIKDELLELSLKDIKKTKAYFSSGFFFMETEFLKRGHPGGKPLPASSPPSIVYLATLIFSSI